MSGGQRADVKRSRPPLGSCQRTVSHDTGGPSFHRFLVVDALALHSRAIKALTGFRQSLSHLHGHPARDEAASLLPGFGPRLRRACRRKPAPAGASEGRWRITSLLQTRYFNMMTFWSLL
jgi:hypothetical protein